MTTERDGATRELDEDDDTPIDPDIELTVHYLEEQLSAAEAGQFEERFVEDEAFAKKVYPLMKIWSAPIDWRAAYEAYKPKTDAAAEPPAQHSSEPAPKDTWDLKAPALTASDAKRLEREAIGSRKPRRRRPFLYAFQSRAKRAYYSVGTIVLGGLGTIWASQAIDKHQMQLLASQGILAEAVLPRGITFVTPAGPDRAVRFGDGSVVVLKAHSRVSYKVGMPPAGLLVTLDGEATLKVSRADNVMMVRTSGRQTMILTGSYAFACDPGCDEVRFTVGTGNALMQGNSRATRVSLTSGQFGRIPKGGAPERTEGGEGYPAISRLGRTAP